MRLPPFLARVPRQQNIHPVIKAGQVVGVTYPLSSSLMAPCVRDGDLISEHWVWRRRLESGGAVAGWGAMVAVGVQGDLGKKSEWFGLCVRVTMT